jgi:hypothetical protein
LPLLRLLAFPIRLALLWLLPVSVTTASVVAGLPSVDAGDSGGGELFDPLSQLELIFQLVATF